MMKENSAFESIRKAAILVSVLDRDSADALLDKMGPEQAARVRDAVFELDLVSQEEQDQIVREFVSAGGGARATTPADEPQLQPVDGLQDAQPRHEDDATAWEFDFAQFALEQGQAASKVAASEVAASEVAMVDGSRYVDPPSSPLAVDKGPAAEPAVDHGDVTGGPHGGVASAAADAFDAPAADGPFPILRAASIETLANHLAHENPQVIAVVVAHLPAQRAADLLAELVPRQQADVLRRVAALDVASPAAIEVLQRQLEAKLTEELRTQHNRSVGLATVNSILNAAGTRRHELLHNLTENDSQLSQLVVRTDTAVAAPAVTRNAAQDASLPEASRMPGASDPGPATTRTSMRERAIGTGGTRPSQRADENPRQRQVAGNGLRNQTGRTQRFSDESSPTRTSPTRNTVAQSADTAHAGIKPLVFEQLVGFDDEALARVFRATNSEITLLALAGASPEFVARVTRPLPPRESRALHRKMERLGPIRLCDIAAAQREVARTATQLVMDGELPHPAPSRFAVAA